MEADNNPRIGKGIKLLYKAPGSTMNTIIFMGVVECLCFKWSNYVLRIINTDAVLNDFFKAKQQSL